MIKISDLQTGQRLILPAGAGTPQSDQQRILHVVRSVDGHSALLSDGTTISSCNYDHLVVKTDGEIDRLFKVNDAAIDLLLEAGKSFPNQFSNIAQHPLVGDLVFVTNVGSTKLELVLIERVYHGERTLINVMSPSLASVHLVEGDRLILDGKMILKVEKIARNDNWENFAWIYLYEQEQDS